MGRAHVVALLGLVLVNPAQAEVYRWTDSKGVLHYSQDLGQVPPAQRAAARAAAESSASPTPQRYSAPAPSRWPGGRGGRTLRIPFEQRGTLMLVQARLNDRVTAPFLVDTGASGVSIPKPVALRLGIPIDPGARLQLVQTANGMVAEPVVQIDSLEVGEARVEQLAALVSSSMEVGLLGGSFFNNFVYQVDPAAGEITLVENAAVRAGLSEAQWRERFQALRDPLGRIERYLEENRLASAERVEELGRRHDALERAFEALEREANASGVPQAWRY